MTRCLGCTHPNGNILGVLWIITVFFAINFIILQIITFVNVHDVNVDKGGVKYINYNEYQVTITDYKCIRDHPNGCYPECNCNLCTNIVTDDVSCDCDYVECTIVGNYNNAICEIGIPLNDDDNIVNTVFTYYEATSYPIGSTHDMYVKHSFPEYCMDEHNIDELSKYFYSDFVACMVITSLFGGFLLTSICYCWWPCSYIKHDNVYIGVEMTQNPINKV